MKFFGRVNNPNVSLKIVMAKRPQKNQKIKFNTLFDIILRNTKKRQEN